MIFDILYALGLWFLAFILTVFSVNAVLAISRKFREQKVLSGIAMQAGFVMYSLIIAHFLAGSVKVIGKASFPPMKLLEALAVSSIFVLALYGVSQKMLREERYEPPLAPRSILELVTLAFMAGPLGEEVLFRGLLEGYMLARNVDARVAVALPAVLFSLIHWIPFKDALSKHRALILFFALVLGSVAGYYRAVTGSITVTVVVHAVFNTPQIDYVLKRRAS